MAEASNVPQESSEGTSDYAHLHKRAREIAVQVERFLPKCELTQEDRTDGVLLFCVSRTDDAGFATARIDIDDLPELDEWLSVMPTHIMFCSFRPTFIADNQCTNSFRLRLICLNCLR
jgi:hypothetical protein